MRGIWVVAALASACDFTPGTAPIGGAMDVGIDAAIDARPANFHVRVEAYIDGRSDLIFKGTTAQWHHYQFAAPGREVGANYPTKFDGADWMPVWPNIPDAENRDCNCTSDVYTGLASAVPRAIATASVTPITVRKPPLVVQQPDAANDYTLIVELTDVGVGGSSWNTVDIDVVVP